MEKEKDPNRKDVTIKEIARIAGVSVSTVSMVLNDRPGVAGETRYRVLKIADSLKYRPNLIARSLVKRRSYAVAMLITNTINPVFPELAAGVEEVLQRFGYSLSIISTHDDLEKEAAEIEKIRSRGVDGIISSSALIDSESIRILARSEYPVVSVLRRVYRCEALDFVVVDNKQGGYVAAEHLIRLGHKRVAVVKGPQQTSTGLERFEGALAAFMDYGLPVRNELIAQGDYFKASGYEAMQGFFRLTKNQRPTAVFACNDHMALGAFEATLDRGLRIPKDIALVGFNNVESTSIRNVEITTVSQRKKEIGRLAAERLIAKIEKGKDCGAPCRCVLDPELIVRKSCGFSLASKYAVERKTGTGLSFEG